MIIIRTPYRISFFGGGTDYPAWYNDNPGSVISTTINKYSFLVLRKLPSIFDYKYRIRYWEKQETDNVEDISVPIIREAIKYMDFEHGIDITHHGDLPNRTGIGSSSSFTVGLVHGLSVLKNQNYTKRNIASDAIHLEQNVIKEAVGSQDQVAAAFGGLNRIDFGGSWNFTCYPLHLKKRDITEFESWVQIFFTSKLRNSHDIASKNIDSIKSKKVDLNSMNELTKEAESILFSSSKSKFYDLGMLLNEQWKIKKSIEETISNSEIDDIYEKGLNAGAIGGKLLGAGGGGFIMFLTPPHLHVRIAEELQLKEVPVNFEHLGSQMIYHDYQDQED